MTKFNIEWAQKNAVRAITELAEMAVAAEAQVTRGLTPIQALKSAYDPMANVPNGIGSYDRYASVGQNLAKWEKDLTERWATCQAIHADNSPAIAANIETKEALRGIMLAVGLKASYNESVLVRGRWKTVETEAGWVKDLRRIQVDDGFEKAKARKTEIERIMREVGKAEQARIEKQAYEIQAEKDRRAELATLAEICTRRGWVFGADTSRETVIDALCTLDAHLDLANAMMQTRNDWGDGFYRVEAALGRFGDTNLAVSEELWGLVNGDETDGRIFRDCHYDYNTILEMVEDETLVEDFNKIN